MGRFITIRRRMTIQQVLKVTLVAQGLVALSLFAVEVESRWVPQGAPADIQEASPILPGDQVRPFDARRPAPPLTNPRLQPEIVVTDEMPRRLTFTLLEDTDFGTLLLLSGAIEWGDAERLEVYLAGLEELPSTIALNSPGGFVDEALAIGRSLRDADFDTIILPGMVCLSSCPYVLAGGVERRVSLEGAVGLHQHYYDTPRFIPVYFAVEDIQKGQGRTMAHLIEMGINPSVMVHALSTPPSEVYVLVDDELRDSRFATEILE